MSETKKPLDLTIIGAGMIVNDLLLPAALQMRREGVIGHITVVDMRSSAVTALRESESLKRAFPDQTFDTCPAPGEPDSSDPELYKKVLAKQKPYQMVIIALQHQRRDLLHDGNKLRRQSVLQIRLYTLVLLWRRLQHHRALSAAILGKVANVTHHAPLLTVTHRAHAHVLHIIIGIHRKQQYQQQSEQRQHARRTPPRLMHVHHPDVWL